MAVRRFMRGESEGKRPASSMISSNEGSQNRALVSPDGDRPRRFQSGSALARQTASRSAFIGRFSVSPEGSLSMNHFL